MRPPFRTSAAAAIGYACGLIPSADIITRVVGGASRDIRSEGSGNPGALNVAQSVGKRAGSAVMIADMAKGFAAGRLGAAVAGAAGANAAAAAAVVGHCFPVTKRFRGGKGVATSVGQVLATFPPYFPIDFAVAAAAAANPRWKNRAFVANSVASAVWVAASLLWWRKRWPNLWGPAPSAALPLASAVSSAAIAKRFLDEGRS